MLNRFCKLVGQGVVLTLAMSAGVASADVRISDGWLRAVPRYRRPWPGT